MLLLHLIFASIIILIEMSPFHKQIEPRWGEFIPAFLLLVVFFIVPYYLFSLSGDLPTVQRYIWMAGHLLTASLALIVAKSVHLEE